ncbi:hypothetical protein BP6252_08970 [Coleophoma cylindrospora]|uniref:Uncharacterized protein n=1 Tax=Coleophoma cylindrospora TaxID=1849047 RepID=A0A3D8R164_9HELO|nr:hypothetical protein BP6252_08970 [Coleophoma cylindrospora]
MLSLLVLLELQPKEAADHRRPVQVVGDHTSIRRTVLPTQKRVENTPPPTARELWVAAVDMPHAPANIIRTRARSVLRGIAAGDLVPLIGLEEPDSSREQAGGDMVQEARGDGEEESKGRHVAALVNQDANDAPSCNAGDGGQRNGTRGGADGHAADKHNALDAFPENGDEGQDEQRVALTPQLEALAQGAGVDVADLEALEQLEAPFRLQLGDAQHGHAHNGDNHRRDHAEDTFPDVLAVAPFIHAEDVEGSNEQAAQEKADGEANGGAEPYLARRVSWMRAPRSRQRSREIAPVCAVVDRRQCRRRDPASV